MSKLEPGGMIKVEWRGKAIYIVRRTDEMLAELDKITDLLADPNSEVSEQQPEYATNQYRSIDRHYLVVEGTAAVTPGGAPELLQRLAKTYIGPDAVFPPMPDPPPGFVIRVTPQTVRGMGPWGTHFD